MTKIGQEFQSLFLDWIQTLRHSVSLFPGFTFHTLALSRVATEILHIAKCDRAANTATDSDAVDTAFKADVAPPFAQGVTGDLEDRDTFIKNQDAFNSQLPRALSIV